MTGRRGTAAHIASSHHRARSYARVRLRRETGARGCTWLAHVDRVDFAAWAELFAREIIDNKPDLVGLQEVALWRTGAFADPAQATTIRYDYLALLTTALARSGHPYDVAVVQQEADLEAPAGYPYFLDLG